jgi:hypothetical protein
MVSRNEHWVTQQNDYFIAKSQPYALAHCSRELQNLEPHGQNVHELSLSLSLSLSHTHRHTHNLQEYKVNARWWSRQFSRSYIM